MVNAVTQNRMKATSVLQAITTYKILNKHEGKNITLPAHRVS